MNFDVTELFSSKKSESTMEHLMSVCDHILQNYDKEQMGWIRDVDSSRVLDALRLNLLLTPAPRTMLAPLKYRTERVTFLTRWLKISFNKHIKSVTSRTYQSGNIIGFGGRSLEQVVTSIGSMDIKDANQISSELIRALIMKYRSHSDVCDAFFDYIFTTPSKQLPNKLKRARQTLESKDVAHLTFNALYECAINISGLCIVNDKVKTYLDIFHDLNPHASERDTPDYDEDSDLQRVGGKKRKRKEKDINDATDVTDDASYGRAQRYDFEASELDESSSNKLVNALLEAAVGGLASDSLSENAFTV